MKLYTGWLAPSLKVLLLLLLPSLSWADESRLAKASVLGLRLGDSYEAICEEGDIGGWSGLIGNPRIRTEGTMKSVPPAYKEPYDAQLEPPAGTKYLGGDLKSLNLYFDFEGGDFRIFAISFQVEGVDLEKVLTRQFGSMTTGSGWTTQNTMLLLQGSEVLLFDIGRRDAAELWYYTNQGDFAPRR
jgi:hypothetical protein